MPERSDKLRRLPRQRLADLPTPLVELTRLSRFLGGPRILIKRDDQTGLAFGGNKTRKLEFLVGDAIALGADVLVTGGAAQSNHCRQTAAAAAASGLECHLALGGAEPDQVNGNLLLDRLLGSHIHWCGDDRKGERIPSIVTQLRAAGKNPYVVPYGGSSAVGTLGYAEATRELLAQLSDAGERLTHMVFASSSGGTHAGLMLGQRLFDHAIDIVGFQIEPESADEVPLAQKLAALATDAASLISDSNTPSSLFSSADVILRQDAVGDYGVVRDVEREAVAILAQQEGILLDPVYTGRAMAGLIAMIRAEKFNQNDTVLFWHTGGGPALFAYAPEIV